MMVHSALALQVGAEFSDVVIVESSRKSFFDHAVGRPDGCGMILSVRMLSGGRMTPATSQAEKRSKQASHQTMASNLSGCITAATTDLLDPTTR